MINKVLIITSKSDITTDFIIKELKNRNANFYRFNTDELTKSVSVSLDFNSNKFELKDFNTQQNYNLLDFSSVYYRRPELPLFKNTSLTYAEIQFIEHEILYTLEGIYKILNNKYWISPLYAIREAENKIHQLILAKKIGFLIPDSLITNQIDIAKSFFARNSNECILKPIKSGLIEEENGDKVVFTSKINKLPDSSESIESCPTFFQKHIKKNSDVRVTVIGNEIFATKINSQAHIQTSVDWRKGEMVLDHEKIILSDELSTMCISLLKKLNLKFGAIDFILDENGNYVFLEINPNGQWAWIEKQTGYQISKAIVNLLLNENF